MFLKGDRFPVGVYLLPAGLGGLRGGGESGAVRSEDHEKNGDRAAAAHDWNTAESEFRSAIASSHNPSDITRIRASLTTAYTHDGKRAEAVAELGNLQHEVEAAGNPELMAQLFVSTAETIGEGDRALSAAREMAVKYPKNPWFERTIAWETFQKHDLETAAPAINKAVELTQNDLGSRGFLLQLRSTIMRTLDTRTSIESALEAYLINRDKAMLQELLKRTGPNVSSDLVTDFLNDLRASDQARREVGIVMVELRHPSVSAAMETLDAHLRQAIMHVRTLGAEPILMSYPFPTDANDVLGRVARETGAGWIDLEPQFSELLKTQRREDLFAADGHLNDRGYDIVAGIVARDVRRRNKSFDHPVQDAERDSTKAGQYLELGKLHH